MGVFTESEPSESDVLLRLNLLNFFGHDGRQEWCYWFASCITFSRLNWAGEVTFFHWLFSMWLSSLKWKTIQNHRHWDTTGSSFFVFLCFRLVRDGHSAKKEKKILNFSFNRLFSPTELRWNKPRAVPTALTHDHCKSNKKKNFKSKHRNLCWPMKQKINPENA